MRRKVKYWGWLLSLVLIVVVASAQMRHSDVPVSVPESLGVTSVTSPQTQVQILFIHGSPGSKEGYSAYLKRPDLRKSADLVSIDRLGYGESDPLPEPSILMQAQAILPFLSKDKANILVGHSLGGPIALQLGLIAPNQISGMVFVAPAFDPELEHPKWYNRIADTLLAKWVLPTEWNQSNVEMMSLSKELELLASRDWSALTMPINIVHGVEDDIADPGNSVFAINKLPKQSVKLIQPPDEGHFVLWQNVPLVVESIHQVIGSLSNE
ncbi:putative Alpha/beta hydrolase [Vibrio nigripulchritudo SOn1]|uniref:Alpha/beta hydrolase n=1 Tax=Vibrio nigripulchritudo SOn1 TaxID=1238450 RepID=A0AAV2VZU5_9VIBR|nr:alpha/beta hydrolase [Vibrio nigripulchritudo]CCO50149.1 putative Alpha/beta hydrolase [Vibrio nigripulchritudo SOn1]